MLHSAMCFHPYINSCNREKKFTSHTTERWGYILIKKLASHLSGHTKTSYNVPPREKPGSQKPVWKSNHSAKSLKTQSKQQNATQWLCDSAPLRLRRTGDWPEYETRMCPSSTNFTFHCRRKSCHVPSPNVAAQGRNRKHTENLRFLPSRPTKANYSYTGVITKQICQFTVKAQKKIWSLRLVTFLSLGLGHKF